MPILEAVRDNWLVLLIPVFAGLVGWITNVAAVWLLFHPVEFVGIRPFLGWQGIIPGAASRMGAYLAKLIAEKLLDVRELLAGVDLSAVLPAARPALRRMADDLIEEAAGGEGAPLWNSLDEKVKEQVRTMVRGEVELLATKAFADLQQSADEILNLAVAIRAAILKDRALLNNLFLAAGSEEFKFIKISGLYFGFLFGIPQFIAWCYYPAWWELPVGGLLVGYVTNWLAMKMIFEPKTPKKIGPFTFQGLFHKRQHEVAVGFSHTVSETILTPAAVVAHIAEGEGRGKIREIFSRHAGELVEKYRKNPMTGPLLGNIDSSRIDRLVVQQIDAQLTEEGGFLWRFIEQSLNVAATMADRLRGLDPESFEGVLRPAFQQDEWKLIAVGAVLGGIAGWLQVVYMFGDMVMT